MTVNVKLITVDDVKKFCNAASRSKVSVDVIQGTHRIDGASLMGMFSLDLSEPVAVEFEDENFKDEIATWVVDG